MHALPQSQELCDISNLCKSWLDPMVGGGCRRSGPPLKNHKKVFCNIAADPEKSQRLKARFLSLANVMFKWRFASGPMMVRL